MDALDCFLGRPGPPETDTDVQGLSNFSQLSEYNNGSLYQLQIEKNFNFTTNQKSHSTAILGKTIGDFKGKLLFSLVELVEVIVPNLKCGH